MPDRYRIVLTELALSDLAAIADFIRQHSPKSSAIVAQTILDAIDSLDSMPDRFKQVGKSRKRGTPIHSMVVRPFLVYYRVTSSPPTVHVLTIRHGSRRPPRRFD
jgi:toxin ParE1/3/4